ncbi:hypothetical protein AAF712_008256 [Marasmius tenuissimus]|uniref:Uncharacterized protein n=1 Tax=Marasmius tenuissimus TaxID=585030 RepID=A0ABR2ZUW9_9AGAR
MLLATTSVAALLTPLLLSQAYRVNTVMLKFNDSGFEVLDAVSFGKMTDVKASAQLNIGMHSWEADSSYAETIGAPNFYYPADSVSNNSWAADWFIAGNIANATVRSLRGLQLKISCAHRSSEDLDVERLNTSWTTFCHSHIPDFHGPTPGNRIGGTTGPPNGNQINFSIYFCNNGSAAFPFSEGPQSQNMGYAYYTYTRTLGATNVSQNTSGLIQCNSTLTTGTAFVHGSKDMYKDFSPQWLLNSTNATEPLIDPLYAAFNGLGEPQVDLESTILRYGSRDLRESSELDFDKDALNSVLGGLYDGVVIFADALARLSRDAETYTAELSLPVALYTRDNLWASSACALLSLWFLLMVALTLWGYRRTFVYNLDSYVAAELIFRADHLLEDLPLGEVDDNQMLKDEPFDFDSLPSKVPPRGHKDDNRLSEGTNTESPLAGADNSEGSKDKASGFV